MEDGGRGGGTEARVGPRPWEASTDHLEFLQELLNSDLPPIASEDITDALKKGAITSIAGGELARPYWLTVGW